MSPLAGIPVVLVTGALSFALTIALISYLIGDNPLYRLAMSIFIGVSTGYITLVAIYLVIVPFIIQPLASGSTNLLLVVVPLVLFGLLLFKLVPRVAVVGDISVAFLIGVGSAVAIGGAVQGTILPQVGFAWNNSGVSAIDMLIMSVMTSLSLLSFLFWVRTDQSTSARPRAIMLLTNIGNGIVMITLGAIYGGVITSGITVLAQHFADIWAWITLILQAGG